MNDNVRMVMGVSRNIKKCKHCEEVCYLSQKDFCCKGCEIVHSLIQSKDLTLINKAVKGESFSYLDNQEFLKKFTQQDYQMEFYLEGVHCSQCLWLLEQLPHLEEEILKVELDMSKNIICILISPNGKFSTAAQLLSALGYKPHPINSLNDVNQFRKKEERSSLLKLGVAAFLAGNIMLMSISLYSGADALYKRSFEWISLFLFLPIIFYSAFPFWQTLWRFIFFRKPHVDIPIGVALFFGTALSVFNVVKGSGEIYFDSLSVLVTLILGTRYLLLKVKGHYLEKGHLISFLIKQSVTRFKNGNREAITAEQIKVNDVLELKQGERFPVDAKLLSDEAYVNMAVIDGETVPRILSIGDKIISGTQLLSESCKVVALDNVRSSYLGKMLEEVEKEAFKKKGIVTVADKYAKDFTVLVLLVSLIMVLLGSFVLGINEAIERALALVIIACPCALAFSLPLVQGVSLLKASSKGILIKTVDVFEKIKYVKKVFFDKTGTLTHGHYKVVSQSSLISSEEAKKILALELRSSHPVALTLVQYIRDLFGKIQPKKVNNFTEVLGKGVKGEFEDGVYELCSIERSDGENSNTEIINNVAFKKNGEVRCVFSLGDEILTDSLKVIEKLKSEKLEPIIISGDTKENVMTVARYLKLPESHQKYKLSPQGKLEVIKGASPVMMIGEGLNDTLALAASDIGIAVNGSMESSLKVADVYLSKPRISLISDLFEISRDVNKVIKRNLILSFLYNVTAGVFAILGYINPLVAAILMPVSSLLILISTLYGVGFLRPEKNTSLTHIRLRENRSLI